MRDARSDTSRSVWRGERRLRFCVVASKAPRPDAGWVAKLPAPPPPPGGDADPRLHDLWRLDAPGALPGPGWSRLLDELHARLVALDPDYGVQQIKEKFGGLRFCASFSEPVRRQCLALVAEAERRSQHICERCGEPGELRMERARRLTLCDDCNLVV